MKEKNYKSGTSFSMPFGGTDIWFSELSGIGKDQAKICSKLREQADVYQNSIGKLNVAVNLIATRPDRRNCQLLVSIIVESRQKIKKLVVVGSGILARIQLRMGLEKHRKLLGFRYDFFDDYEQAKRYLVEI